jgi:hypothetical protein
MTWFGLIAREPTALRINATEDTQCLPSQSRIRTDSRSD